MTLGFALLLGAVVLIVSGLGENSIVNTILGIPSDKHEVFNQTFGGGSAAGATDSAGGGTVAASGPLSGTPKEIIDTRILPVARSHGINVTAASVAAANARHGPTVSGGRSDHQGPPDQAWAADMSNGTAPTPQMQALADDLNKMFGMGWTGHGLVSKNVPGYRLQLIHKCGGPCNPSPCGGNHCNHVHFGVHRA